jgi:hypothetical protein
MLDYFIIAFLTETSTTPTTPTTPTFKGVPKEVLEWYQKRHKKEKDSEAVEAAKTMKKEEDSEACLIFGPLQNRERSNATTKERPFDGKMVANHYVEQLIGLLNNSDMLKEFFLWNDNAMRVDPRSLLMGLGQWCVSHRFFEDDKTRHTIKKFQLLMTTFSIPSGDGDLITPAKYLEHISKEKEQEHKNEMYYALLSHLALPLISIFRDL